MISALLLGSGTAVLWGWTSFLSAPYSRIAGPVGAFYWTTLAETVISVPLAAATGPPSGTVGDWLLVFASGVAYAGGMALWLFAVSRGRVSVVVPIVATDGGIAAVLSVLAGAKLSVALAIAMAAMVAGIIFVTAAEKADADEELQFTDRGPRPLPQLVALGLAAAVCFGLVFFTSGHATSVPAFWVVAGARCSQLICASVALVWVRPKRLPRSVWHYLAIFAVTDIGGYVLFIRGARFNPAIASVAASQYAALAVLGGLVVYGERLGRRQGYGIALVLAAVAAIAAFS
jgi:drug/metabolite transporter (DMT)-like permease